MAAAAFSPISLLSCLMLLVGDACEKSGRAHRGVCEPLRAQRPLSDEHSGSGVRRRVARARCS